MTAGDLLILTMPRLAAEPPTTTFLNALNGTIGAISRYLLERRSALLAAEFSVSVSAGTSSFTLPDGYRGFVERPYVGTTQLSKLPAGQRNSHTVAGTPRYYEIVGTTGKLYPAPAADTTITGLYFKCPDKIEAITDELPWGGLFDHLIEDAIVLIGKGGGWVTMTPPFGYITTNLDTMLSRYNQRDLSFVGSEMAPITSTNVK